MGPQPPLWKRRRTRFYGIREVPPNLRGGEALIVRKVTQFDGEVDCLRVGAIVVQRVENEGELFGGEGDEVVVERVGKGEVREVVHVLSIDRLARSLNRL